MMYSKLSIEFREMSAAERLEREVISTSGTNLDVAAARGALDEVAVPRQAALRLLRHAEGW